MRALLIGLVMASLCVASAVDCATAADVSDRSLAAMGLGGMQKLSDAQGEQIRGKGFVMAWQTSETYTVVSGASSSQGFISTSRRGSPRVAELEQSNETSAGFSARSRSRRRGSSSVNARISASSQQSLIWRGAR